MTTRVLQVLGRSAGGIARHVAQITAALDSEELEIDVAGPDDLPITMPKPVVSLEIPDGVAGHTRAVTALRRILVDGRYDLVHAHGLRAGIDAAVAARSRGKPSLLTVHNLVRADVSGRTKAAFYRHAEPLSVRLSTRTFVVSEDIARHLRSSLPRTAAKVEVLYLGIGKAPEVGRDREAVRRELELEDDDMLVVTASRLSPQKALDVMLSAVELLEDRVVLAVLGEGPDGRRLEGLAAEKGIAARIRWLGWRNDIADFIAAAEAFCLSSNWEGVPLAAQEAILLGTPVVATDVGGMSELVTDGRGGRLVGKGDAEALAGALHEVLFDEATALRYVERARRDLTARFSTERMLARLKEAYRWYAR